MKRREFIAIFGAAAAAWPCEVFAQRTNKRSRIAWLAGVSEAGAARYTRVFLDGMRELGYTADRDFEMTYRFADGYIERLPKLAQELVQLKPDIIIAAASANAIAVKKLTTTIPIVVPALGDPVALGLIESDARPGGNVTGVTPYVKGLPGKQLDLAREIIPRAIRVGLLDAPADVKAAPQRREIEASAKEAGLSVVVSEVRTPDDIRLAYDKFVAERVDVAIVEETNMFLNARKQIADAAAATKLPSVYGYREHIESGGLISYGVDLQWCFHRAASYVDKILKGRRPGDLPVEFPTKLQLVVNLKTAKALGLTMSQTLLFRADEVIE